MAPVVGATNQTFTATENGNYAVQLTNGACIETSDCIEITAFNNLTELYTTSITIYPNPFEIGFELKSEYSGTMALVDIAGKVILEDLIVAGNNSFQVDHVAPGAYMVFITLENGNHEVLQVIKI
jgi:hypothetical protein